MNNYYHFEVGFPIDDNTADEHMQMNNKTTTGSVNPEPGPMSFGQ